MVTILIISILAITRRSAGRIRRMTFTKKVVLQFLPALGACMSFMDMVLLIKKELYGEFVVYDEWLFRSSQLVVWTTIIISARWACFHEIFCNQLICFWWIMKVLLEIVHLYKTFALLEREVFRCLKESSVVLLDIMFGLSINIIRIKQASQKSSSIEDPLLAADMDIEGDGHSGNTRRCWDLMTFKSITSLLKRGTIKQLDFEDLLWLPNDMEPSTCHDRLLSCWQVQLRSSNPFLFKAIGYAYGWPYFCIGLLKVFNDLIGFAGPLLLNKLIRFLQQGSAHQDGYVLALSLGLTSILKSFLDTQYTFHLAKLKLKLRSGIMTVIYQKCLSVTLAERSKFSEGEVQTFMSVDADRTVNLCNSFHDVWSLPLQIGVALYLLYTQVKFAFLSGLAITILLIPVNKWISELIATATEKMMKQKDERIRRTGEILTHIRTLKMYGWEHLFSSWLMETRSSEVKHLATRKYLDAWCVFFWATTPTLFSLFTFGIFTLMGHQLEAATVFTCLALFNNLISPLNSFPWVINGLIDALVSIRRLSRFLCCSEYRREIDQKAESPSLFLNYQSDSTSKDMAVIMHDACCAWSSSNEQHQNLVLNHATLSLPKGSFIAITGEVGSGKSSLLGAILGEMRLIHGSVHSNGSIAYVPQVPWILSGTVRDNILFGMNYEPKRYSDTIKACALDVDISLMVGGDMAYIGEKGVNLSGGQRARLALARAIYQRSDVYILDDVLSAVDSEVGRWILYNVIFGPLMDQKTRVLCTHNIQAISSADMIVVMDKGYVKWVGSSADLPISSYSAFSPQNEFDTLPYVQGQEISIVTSIEGRKSLTGEKESSHISEDAQEIVEVEIRKEGRVELAVYKNYAAFSGWSITVVICLSAILMQASRNGNDLWLSYWVDTTASSPAGYSTSFFLVVLCIFCIINSSLTLVRAFSFAFGGLHAAVKVHNTLLSKLIDAPVWFFDQTPAGRILNRMSSDLYTIDDSLPFILNILLANFVGLLGIAIVLSYVQVVFLLLLLPFWFIYSRLQFFYRSTSRELRRLDSVSRSPIYATFTETLDGSSTIRAFNSEDYFFAKFTEHVTLYQRTSYSEIIASLWLSLRLQLLAAFIITFVAMMAVVGSRGYLPISFGTPGLVGLALSYAAPIVSLLGSFLTSFTETEKEMVSVERALQYMDIPQEELRGSLSLNPNWPFQGQIKFQNVTMRYMPSLPPALNCVTFTILGGTQVGIVGRTGAGKSSILNALFRLSPICGGCILVDSINIIDVPVRDLRSHFSVVPQSPFLFEGSLRENLDPLQMTNDFEIWSILEKCHVKEEVEMAGGLDVHIKQSRSSFSVGQRQLLCFARALLKSSKVLCLDECTASVDTQTASVLQHAISTECKGMTVITIAHRISSIMNMDNILVLDRGNVIEQGNPQALLQDEFSKFSSFAKASTM
ncbi:ABC transporter C family member 13 isoform X2 [Jatropha curcas]|nr:ABC transporter C family member 13 isoform X2 [Jatropha curcas]